MFSLPPTLALGMGNKTRLHLAKFLDHHITIDFFKLMSILNIRTLTTIWPGISGMLGLPG
jgi:hypothetical protein